MVFGMVRCLKDVLRYEKNLVSDKYFVPVITFLLYAVCELLGQILGFRFAPKVSFCA